MKELTEHLRNGNHLGREEVEKAVQGLTSPTIDAEEKAEFLCVLQDKGETPDEIADFVQVLLQLARDPKIDRELPEGRPLLDVCGTGGDKAGLFNVSTAVVFVAAACKALVVKHGNRGITSKSGGADVLQALGVPIDLPPEENAAFLERVGFVFLFAPQYHPAFKEIVPVRKLLAGRGRSTIFNILGPLLNPARPDYQLAGVFDPALLNTYGKVFQLLGRRGAWAVHGSGPGDVRMDELSTLGPSEAVLLCNGELTFRTIEPTALDLAPARMESLQGGTPEENANMITAILESADRGPKRDLVLLNAAAACCACGIVGDLEQGVAAAAEAVDSGKALQVLQRARDGKR